MVYTNLAILALKMSSNFRISRVLNNLRLRSLQSRGEYNLCVLEVFIGSVLKTEEKNLVPTLMVQSFAGRKFRDFANFFVDRES